MDAEILLWCQALHALFGRVPALQRYFTAPGVNHTNYWEALNESLNAVAKGEKLSSGSLFEQVDSQTLADGDLCKSYFART